MVYTLCSSYSCPNDISDGQRLSSVEERCEALKKNIAFLENKISIKGHPHDSLFH
jgi:hypothetical protein